MASPLQIKRAVRRPLHLRMALSAPPGGERTCTALRIAFGVLGVDLSKLEHKAGAEDAPAQVLVIDTDHRSASKFASEFPPFDVIELDSFAPEAFIEALNLAESEGYRLVIADTLTHEWNGRGGVLDIVDTIAAVHNGGSAAGWKVASARHEALLTRIDTLQAHFIGCFRAKQQIAVDRDATGQLKITRLVTTMIAREGTEAEFDVAADVQPEGNTLAITTSRYSRLTGMVFPRGGGDLARILAEWLATGEASAEGAVRAGTTHDSGGRPTDDEATVRARLLEAVGVVIGDRHESANRLFRIQPSGPGTGAWIGPAQTWRDLSIAHLEWVLQHKEKIVAQLAKVRLQAPACAVASDASQ